VHSHQHRSRTTVLTPQRLQRSSQKTIQSTHSDQTSRSNNAQESRSKKITPKKADSHDPAGSNSHLGRTARALWRRLLENAGAP
jgi:phage terminase small subunit